MRKSQSKSRMLLLELLLAVFIFSFCVIICAGVFFEASNIAQDSKNLTYAAQMAQSAAEAFKATDTLEELAWLLDGELGADGMTVYYDSGWNTQQVGSGGDYALIIAVKQESPGTETARISIMGMGEDLPGTLYAMFVTKLEVPS